ncbi:MAG: hypothetical protein JHC93_08630 [Parachlamydiales bacterium]|nr:hypothetical protein [Parachlamydiales bacterium]
MSISPNIPFEKTIDRLCSTLDLLNQKRATYDKNLKMIKNTPENQDLIAKPHEVFEKILNEISEFNVSDNQKFDEKKWGQLTGRIVDYVKSADYTDEHERTLARNISKQVLNQIIKNLGGPDSDKTRGLFINIYQELDGTFQLLNSNVVTLMLTDEYDALVESGIGVGFELKTVLLTKERHQLSTSDFTYNFQKSKLKLTDEQKKSLEKIMAEIDLEVNQGDNINIDQIEKIVKNILILKRDNLRLERTCDQLLKVLDFMLKNNEYPSITDVHVFTKKVPNYFPPDFPRNSKLIDELGDYLKTQDRNKFSTEKRKKMLRKLYIEMAHKSHDALRDLAYKLYRNFKTEKELNEFHEQLINEMEPLHYLPTSAIGPSIFEMKLLKPNESVFTQFITPSLISELDEEIDLERSPKPVVLSDNKLSFDETVGKSETDLSEGEVKPMRSISSENITPVEENIEDTVIDAPLIKKPLNIVEEMHRLNSPSLSPIKSSKRKNKVKADKKETLIQSPKSQEITYKIREYKEPGQSKSLYGNWVLTLPQASRGIVFAKVNNLKLRQKVTKSVGDEVYEVRVFQVGLRVYFKYTGNTITILLGGNKQTQSRDIEKAKAIAKNL